MKLEYRYLQNFKTSTEEIQELEKKEGGDPFLIRGYAAVFNSDTEIYPGFKERIARNAFSESIKGDIRALWSHNPDFILGRTTNNTLSLREDDYGLYFELKLPDTSLGRDLKVLVENRTITGMSFGFIPLEDTWTKGEGTREKPHIRTLNKIDLFEVSPVAWPAYPQTSVSSRDLLEEQEKRWKSEVTEKEKTDLSKYYTKLNNLEMKSMLWQKHTQS